MGLKTFVKNVGMELKRTWTADHAPDWVFGSNGISGVSGLLNVPGIHRPGENVLMVFGCIVARREAIGGVPLRLSDGEENLIESGPLWNLLQKPNSFMDWDSYVRALETYNTLYNCMIVAKVGDGDLPDELVPLSPGCIRAEMGAHVTGVAVPVGYDYTDPNTGISKHFSPDQLIIRRGFNPHAPMEALSPLTVLKRTMQAELSAREQNLALFQNDATPKGILQTDLNLTKEQADEVLGKWNDAHKGFGNRHKTAALWGGLKYQALGLSPAEMEYLNGLKFLRTDYYIVFRVTPAMLGEMTGETGLSQGSSTDSQKVQWWENVGLAELDLIAGMHQELITHASSSTMRGAADSRLQIANSRTRTLTRAEKWTLNRRKPQMQSNAFVWFDDNVIPALANHRLTKLDQLVKVVGLGYRPDEVNDWLDLGLPEHTDNEARVPFSMSVIGGEESTTRAPFAGANYAGQEAEEGTARSAVATTADLNRKLSELEEMLVRADGATPKKWQGARKAFDAYIKPLERAAAKKFSRFFMEQRDRVLERLKAEGAVEIVRAAMTEEQLLAKIFPKDDENGLLIARLSPLWAEHLKAGWDYFKEEFTGQPVNPFTVEDRRVMKALERRQFQGAKMNATTAEDLRGILRNTFGEGLTVNQTAEVIADYYKNNAVGETNVRPMTAARTQTAGIVNEGRMLAAQEAGGLKKGWLHGSPEDPREAHLQAQREYLNNPIGLTEKFVVNGIECDAPGSTELPVEEVANCTCMVVFVPEKFAKELK